MRIGQNPEKNKQEKIIYGMHRIIIPVYIPDSNEEYFSNLFEVFKTAINSIFRTINQDKTLITVLNNNCKEVVTSFIDELLGKNLIDKHVKFNKNYGKVYAVLSESKATYEDLITVVDADVFFFNNWENEVMNVFNSFKKVGVVGLSPSPHLHNYCNFSSAFFNFRRTRKGKVVENEELKLFEEGINNFYFFDSYREKQTFIEFNSLKVCLGAGHFAATYRGDLLRSIDFEKPEYVFKDGYEEKVLDSKIDKIGYFRVSLVKAHVYHLGNTLPEWVTNYNFLKPQFKKVKLSEFVNIKWPYLIGRVLNKIFTK